MTVIDMTDPNQRIGYHLIALKGALGLYHKTKMIPRRGITITRMLEQATQYTGNRYPKNQKGAGIAAADLAAILDKAMGRPAQ